MDPPSWGLPSDRTGFGNCLGRAGAGVARSLNTPSSQRRTGAQSRTETSVLILIGLNWGMLPAHTLP